MGGDKQPNQHVMSQMVKNAMGKKKGTRNRKAGRAGGDGIINIVR